MTDRSTAALVICLSVAALRPPDTSFAQQAAPQQTPAPAAQAPPVARVPVFNRANEALPAWLRVRGEFRERMEGFDSLGFTEGRDDLYWLSRFRFNATVTPSKFLSFQAQVQDARVAKKTVGPTGTPFKAPFDLRTGFADIGSATGAVSVRVGRQELVYGEQRLIGHVSWLNAARTFDAAKVTVRTKVFQIDTFAASVVRIMDGAFDRSGAGNRFAGAYLTTARLIPLGTVEPYVFFKRDVNLRSELGAVDDLVQTTTGIRLAGKLPARLDYGVEMGLRRGSVGGEEVRAWSRSWSVRG